MIFGRRKRGNAVEDDLREEQAPEETAMPEDDDVDADVAPGEELSPEELQAREWDAAFTRTEGPFDISEVDLDADDVKRVDFGALVATPFEGMTMQLNVHRESKGVQSILVGDGQSGLEVSLFAGPNKSSMADEVRAEIAKSTVAQGGQVKLVEGPFGAEMRRAVPVTDPEGRKALHVSRTWLVSGPGWLLRGVLLGKATFEPENEDAQVALFEFFSNLVVRRGTQPAAPGSALALRMPEQE
ncbi:DUF3710 domain-containing protein [Tessaracoccus defluvii]|uniref:DUF3710 domain-containing protein n=1 Tax=Tessaracoccus defluvii TaxID=1285901 RepID=A0A7H0H8K2_9ACTN|nr:DUF3710 domain-containing protein [Tessaracoccus defluvii]QNP56868.1 DUF3710 domain-containing protein [Tessaracoccus defluvii]